MTTTTRPGPVPTRRPSPPPADDKPTAQFAVARPRPVVPLMLVYAVEGWGKTSMVAHAPGAALLMARGETGYDTLLGAGRVPAIPTLTADTFGQAIEAVDSLIADPGDVRVLGVDAIGAAERLCHEKVCAEKFKNDWGEGGFLSFHKGYGIAVSEWLIFLRRLERLRDSGVAVVLLGHAKVKMFKNPDGPDYDQYVCDVHDTTWAVTARVCDAVLFGKFDSVIEGGSLPVGAKQGRKGKGIGGAERVLHAERRDAWHAKNRYGMPEQIEIPGDPAQTWATVMQHITKG